MFSLIITIVSIALVAVLVGATTYYLGDTLTDGRNRAEASAFASGGQQIAGAIQLHVAMEGSAPADMAALISSSYLTGAPAVKSGGTWAINTSTGLITNTVSSADVCEAINTLAGESAPDAVTAIAGTYGCITADLEFRYKF